MLPIILDLLIGVPVNWKLPSDHTLPEGFKFKVPSAEEMRRPLAVLREKGECAVESFSDSIRNANYSLNGPTGTETECMAAYRRGIPRYYVSDQTLWGIAKPAISLPDSDIIKDGQVDIFSMSLRRQRLMGDKLREFVKNTQIATLGLPPHLVTQDIHPTPKEIRAGVDHSGRFLDTSEKSIKEMKQEMKDRNK